jgi:anti-sigma regulatory factor (Ser/Thr protein kinase)
VVVLYHREDETRRIFKQLERVTENYSIIVVDNGFDDRDFVRRLQPLHYVENVENTGAIRGRGRRGFPIYSNSNPLSRSCRFGWDSCPH